VPNIVNPAARYAAVLNKDTNNSGAFCTAVIIAFCYCGAIIGNIPKLVSTADEEQLLATIHFATASACDAIVPPEPAVIVPPKKGTNGIC
jgi:hypothetical protein